MPDVAIIGAGTSGLFTGALLAKNGYDVVIYEKGEIGGRARSIKRKGFVLDYGVHAIRNGKKGFVPVTLAELGEKIDVIDVGRPESIYFEGGKLRRFGESKESLEAVRSAILSRMRGPAERKYRRESSTRRGIKSKNWEKSMLDWLNEIGVAASMHKFFSLAALGIVCPWLDRASLGEFFDFTLRKIKSGLSRTGYPSGGWHVIHDRLIDVLLSHGGEIKTKTEVEKIRVRKNAVSSILTNDGKADADIVVCAFPCHDIFAILDEKLVAPADAEKMKKLVPTCGVSIDYCTGKRITDVSSIVLSVEDIPIIGMVTSNIDPSVSPPGKQLLTFTALSTFPLRNAGKLVSMLEARVFRMFPDLRSNIEMRRVLKLPMIDGVELNIYQHRMARPSPDEMGIDGLFLAGDTLCAAGAGGELAVTSAMLCVDKIISQGTGQKHF